VTLGRVSEGSGEDPLGSQIAKAMVKGYQGDDLSLNNTILSCQTFCLYGAPEGGRDYNTVDMVESKCTTSISSIQSGS
jgi:beta-glucosidase